MGMRCSFDYAVVRVVPHVERQEFINAGVILFCDARDFLEARVELDEHRLLALAPSVTEVTEATNAMERAEIDIIRRHLEAIPRICQGGHAAGPIGQLPLRERWHWLVAPRSTILQMSPPHSGLTESPADALARLFDRLARSPRR